MDASVAPRSYLSISLFTFCKSIGVQWIQHPGWGSFFCDNRCVISNVQVWSVCLPLPAVSGHGNHGDCVRLNHWRCLSPQGSTDLTGARRARCTLFAGSVPILWQMSVGRVNSLQSFCSMEDTICNIISMMECWVWALCFLYYEISLSIVCLIDLYAMHFFCQSILSFLKFLISFSVTVLSPFFRIQYRISL